LLLLYNKKKQRLHIFEAKLTGGLRWGKGSPKNNGVMNWNEKTLADGHVSWKIRVKEPVELELDLVYVAYKGKHGGRYSVAAAGQNYSDTIKLQPKPETIKKVKYIPHTLGKLKLEPGVHTIELIGTDIQGEELFMPSSILLRK
jgi:hypothetical protein